ncbi:MAG: discoidin domain-containing protein, partial [Kiritimatiellae bacterium]|nr:discoidin domain-containing protein [Kiritimatiellia bacterium]
VNRPGSAQFVKAFLNDREWMEDFAWSGTFPANSQDAWCEASTGPGAGAKAILALEALIFQDGGKWVPFDGGKYEDNEGRRFMTALAQIYSDRDEAWLADVLDAYREAAKKGRLHKSAYDQPVWLWRFALHQGHSTGSCDNMAAQQRHLNQFVNLPMREYGGTCWMIVYRLKNCFGDSVHGPFYYKPWATAGEWPKRKYSQIVGGVCGELSKFGSATANAHGLPSTTVGQPGHCAYSRRLANGKWELNYSVTGHSQMHLCLWNRHPWQYSVAIEKTYNCERETRLAAERLIALAQLAEEMKKDAKSVEAFYQYACAAHREHYGAFNAYGQWLMRTGAPLDKVGKWVRGCAKGMKSGRQPLWDILTPYFERVAKEKGQQELAADLVKFAPLLRQDDDRIQEEADFGTVLKTWGDLAGTDRQTRYTILKAMLAAQFGTGDYFSQTMGWGSEFFSKTADGVATFNKCLSEAIAAASAKSSKKGGAAAADGKIDFRPLILTASRNGSIEAFREMVKMQQKMSPPETGTGAKYPAKDFGGDLVSEDGLLQTSTTCNYDNPARYPLAIDASPVGGGSAFHTDGEEFPWAKVLLAGPTDVTGVLIENRTGGYNASRQVPLVVEVSEDGETWSAVYTDNTVKETYRIDLRGKAPRAKYVRVSRKKGAKKEVFHLNKILVYGRKLY